MATLTGWGPNLVPCALWDVLFVFTLLGTHSEVHDQLACTDRSDPSLRDGHGHGFRPETWGKCPPWNLKPETKPSSAVRNGEDGRERSVCSSQQPPGEAQSAVPWVCCFDSTKLRAWSGAELWALGRSPCLWGGHCLPWCRVGSSFPLHPEGTANAGCHCGLDAMRA